MLDKKEDYKGVLFLGTATLALAILLLVPLALFGDEARHEQNMAALYGGLVPPCVVIPFALLGLARCR